MFSKGLQVGKVISLLIIIVNVIMSYTKAEAYDMLAVYFQCFENACIAARQYAIKYPERRHFSKKVFKRLAKCLRETGHTHPIPPPTRRRNVRSEDNVINVLALVEADPHLSTRKISQELNNVTKSTAHRILVDNKLHPYHVVLHQALSDTDFDRRLEYCHWLRGMCRENPRFLHQVLWTDEATFSSDGAVNLHNMHYWATNNPHWMLELDHQHKWSVNVWCGILGNRIIGPYIFNGRLNGESYLNFLQNELPVLLEDIPLETRAIMWYQHDGCPAHFSQNVRNFLDIRFANRWIGRGSLFPWPPRSPDLTVLDFYLWGRLKELVFATRPTTPEDMVVRIQNAANSISRAEIEAAVSSTRRKTNLCISNDGKHFEHLERH